MTQTTNYATTVSIVICTRYNPVALSHIPNNMWTKNSYLHFNYILVRYAELPSRLILLELEDRQCRQLITSWRLFH